MRRMFHERNINAHLETLKLFEFVPLWDFFIYFWPTLMLKMIRITHKRRTGTFKIKR